MEVHICNLALGTQDKWLPGGGCPASLAEWVSARPREGVSQKTREGLRKWPEADFQHPCTCTHTEGLNICLPSAIYLAVLSDPELMGLGYDLGVMVYGNDI